MPRKTPKRVINKIRREVRKGKSKYSVARELDISEKTVYYHTRDIPSKGPGRRGIYGNTLVLLTELLEKGYVHCQHKCSSNFHTLQKHFPMIRRTQVAQRAVYYLEIKNKEALRALLESKRSRIINYHELAEITKLFDVQLSKHEKHGLLGKT